MNFVALGMRVVMMVMMSQCWYGVETLHVTYFFAHQNVEVIDTFKYLSVVLNVCFHHPVDNSLLSCQERFPLDLIMCTGNKSNVSCYHWAAFIDMGIC